MNRSKKKIIHGMYLSSQGCMMSSQSQIHSLRIDTCCAILDVLKMGLKELIDKASKYLTKDDLSVIEKAYQFTIDAGNPDPDQGLEVALILAGLQMDANCLAAALLQNLPPDDGSQMKRIGSKFGKDTERLVEVIEKISSIPLIAPTEDQAERMRRMFLSMARDIRVVIISLANKLQIIRNIRKSPKEDRHDLAQEALEIYAPLAHRLGIGSIKTEMEDASFRYLNPEAHKEIANLLDVNKTEWERNIAHASRILRDEFDKAGIEAKVQGRPKSIFSINTKMNTYAEQGKEFSDIYDFLALRVLVKEVSDCYHALGVIHQLWHPLPGQFDDYIASPKLNMYQSLHTAVIALGGKTLEIQIRTHEMHRTSEYGIAAHWRYKEGNKKDVDFEEKMAWFRQLMEWRKELSGKVLIESLKTDVFQDQVYVFTPMGEIKELPQGSTPLDFAYRVHTDMGHRCTGAKVNGKLVPLTYQLQNGDMVDIMRTKSDRGPSLDWLNPDSGYIKSSHSREKVRQWFRRRERTVNLEQGKSLFDRERKRLGISVGAEEIAGLFNYADINEFLIGIGCGDISVSQIGPKLAPKEEEVIPSPTATPRERTIATGVQVLGVGNLLTHLAPCCTPVPGDEIIGFVTRTKGVTIHRKNCINVTRAKDQERFIDVSWGAIEKSYPVSIIVIVEDRMGIIKDISTIVSEAKINIESISSSNHDDGTASIFLTVGIHDIGQLSQLLSRLERLREVISASRTMIDAAKR